MRIDPSDFKQLGVNPTEKDRSKTTSTSFADTLMDAVKDTNKKAQESARLGVELAEGKTANIHETMVTMQKADISVRLLISVTNKLIDGYKQLTQLR